MAVNGEPLKFSPFEPRVEMPFYFALFSSKLDHDKLDDSARQIMGIYEPTSIPGDKSCWLQIRANALTATQNPVATFRAEGQLRNYNTYDDFKKVDKADMLHTAGKQIWDAIKDGTIYSIPSLLSSFFVISYADLKKYRFTYWFAHPALHSDPAWKRIAPIGGLTPKESTALVDKVGTWRYGVDSREHGFFLLKKIYADPETPLENPDDNIGYKWQVGSLRDFETGFFNDVNEADQFIAFADPSGYEDNPSWPLRNLLVLVRQRFHLRKAQILCYRDTQSRRHEARSIILSVAFDDVESMECSEMPRVTGWSRTMTNKLAARVTNLAEFMDPEKLADQSVDLNLKLMKWRIAPSLDLDIIKNTKCLLLGAGTLGGYVSRMLLGWGVRKITFIDNGAVSFSNPVRQPLYTYQDCLNGGAPKAIRSAQALKEIYPGVDSEGRVISVPMLGHPITDESKTQSDFESLEEYIKEHDAIFLLMDSRESRWLPTVIGKAHNKIVLNAALGFDTFVVMRHGAKPAEGDKETLGCYFCNDIVAPGDSSKDLTLDQQCTVTRPGVASLASGYCVELLTSILQHPRKQNAPAPKDGKLSAVSYERDPPDHPLGVIPHMIRGYLGPFQNILVRGQSYPYCSACSKPVLDAYVADRWEFVKRALNEKDYIPELSGLAEVQRRAEAMAAEIELSDEEGLDGDDEEVIV